MFIGWAITKVLELTVKGIDELAHSAEHCKERVDELMSSYQSALDTANSNAKTIEDLASKYEELSKGVNNLGENASLATDEYLEYNDIVNKIADMFPTMVQGYTDEGTAILSLKGNVEELRDAYKEAQKAAYEMLIASGEDYDGNDIIKNYQNQVHGESIPWFLRKNVFVASKKDGAKESIEIIKKLTEDVSSLEDFLDIYQQLYKEYNNIGSDKDISTLEKSLQSIGIDDVFTLTEEDLTNIKQSAQTAIRTYQTEIDTALKGMKFLANAYLMTNEDYSDLSDQCKNAASIIVNSMSSEIADGLETKEDVGRYVDNIVSTIKDNQDVQNALVELFSMDTSSMSVDDAKKKIDDYIHTIVDEIHENPLELKVRLGFDDIDDSYKRLQNSIRQLTDDHGTTDRNAYAYLINEIDFDSFTQEQVEFWLKATQGAKNATQAVQMYNDALDDAFEEKNSISFDKAWEDSFTSENDKVKELGNTLLDLAEQGRLTIETFNNADSTDYFKNLGISADEAVSKINKLVDESEQLSSMSKHLSAMSKALGTKRDDGFVDADTLSGFDAEVRGLDSWDKFQEVLGSTTSSYQECEEAANALATEWVNSNDFLRQLTEQNKEYYATQLKAMGIENYKEIIAYAQELNLAKEALAQASFDIATATADEIQSLIDTGTYSELAEQQIWALILAKQTEEGIILDTSTDCQNLLTLAQNAGVTGNAITLLTRLMNIYNNIANGVYGTNEHAIESAKKDAENLKSRIDNILSNGTQNTIVLNPHIKVSPSAKSSAEKAANTIKDTLKDELSDLGDVINYISDTIGDQIDLFEDQKDAAVDALEAEKEAAEEALESEKALVQEKIDAKQAEIDAIEDAAKARKNEIDLQKAQYDLERLQNQKTALVNYMPDTIVI